MDVISFESAVAGLIRKKIEDEEGMLSAEFGELRVIDEATPERSVDGQYAIVVEDVRTARQFGVLVDEL